MELLILILILGLGTYYLIRHPIKSIQLIGKIIATFLLGILALVFFLIFIFGALTLLAAL